MYNGIGLKTVRGTATSGHVTQNKAHVRSNWQRRQQDRHRGSSNSTSGAFSRLHPKTRATGNRELQHHARARELENRLLILREELEDQGLGQEVIEAQIKAKRESESSQWEDVIEEGEEANDEIHLQAVRDVQRFSGGRTCFNCGEPGHIARECRNARPQQNRRPAPSTNTHLELVRKEKSNSEFAKAIGIDKGHVEGVAFDQELQRQRRDERKDQMEKEEAKAAKERKKLEKQTKRAEKEARKRLEKEKKQQKKENKRLEMEKQAAEKVEADEKRRSIERKRLKEDVDKRKKRRSPSSSVSSSSGSTRSGSSSSGSSSGSSSMSSSSSGSYTSTSSSSSSSSSRSRRRTRRRHRSNSSSRSNTPPRRVTVKSSDDDESSVVSEISDRRSRRRRRSKRSRSETPPPRQRHRTS